MESVYRIPTKVNQPVRKRKRLDKVCEEFGRHITARYKQIVASARACGVEQLAFRVIHVAEVGFVGDLVDTVLLREGLIVARHYCHSPKFESFSKMHRSNGHAARCCFHQIVEYCICQSGLRYAFLSTVNLLVRSDETANFLWLDSILDQIADP